MTQLTSSDTATGALASEGDVKSFLTNVRAFIADLLGTDSSSHGSVLQKLRAFLSGSLPKTASYTVVEADRGKVISISGAGGITLNLIAAATLGDGFCFGVVNGSSGTVTLDPNLAEQINGASSYVMQPSESIIVFCDGAKFMLFGKAPATLVSTFNSRSGAVLLTSSDVTTALGFTPSPNSHNHNGVYAPMSAFVGVSFDGTNWTFTRASGATVTFNMGGGGG